MVSYLVGTLAAIAIVGAHIFTSALAKLLVGIVALWATSKAWALALGCQRCTVTARWVKVIGTPLSTLAIATVISGGKDVAD